MWGWAEWRREPSVGARLSVLLISTFLAILVLVAAFGVLVTLTFLVMDRTRMVPGLLDGMRGLVGPAALWLAFLVALTATVGSLYFSEVARFTPCVLCWYQRIAMYPLVFVDADGNVAARMTGEIGADAFGQMLEQLAP